MAKLMMEFNQVAGATAGLSIILVFLTANGFVRRRNYEVFYIVHVVLVILILTMGVSNFEINKEFLTNRDFSRPSSS